MKRAAFIQALVLCLLLGLSWLLLIQRLRTPDEAQPAERPAPEAPAAGTAGTAATDRTAATDGTAATAGAAAPASVPEPAGWEAWLAYLRGQPDATGMRAALRALREALATLPAQEAGGRMLAFLASGYDMPTGLLFQVGPGGRLAGAATLRAVVAGWLGEVDPARAAALAQAELERLGTALDPDTYVVHLRNYAWGGPATPARDAFLQRRLADLMGHAPWLRQPGPAVAEALDVAVHLQAARLVPDLARLAAPAMDPAIRHAAGLALERLADLQPAATMAALAGSAEGAALPARTRAALAARIDPAGPAGRAALDGYLAGASPAEAALFLQYFPNLNRSLSHNLLSAQIPATASAGRLRQALEAVRAWRADPAMAALAGPLAETEARLLLQLTGPPAP